MAPESLVLRRTTLLHQQPSEHRRLPTGPIKPWFLTEGKLAAVLIIPSSWGLPTNVSSHVIGPNRLIIQPATPASRVAELYIRRTGPHLEGDDS